jgi:hypothetical protein
MKTTIWMDVYEKHKSAITGGGNLDVIEKWGLSLLSNEVLSSMAHMRTVFDWLLENGTDLRNCTEDERQAHFARARVALTAHGVMPCVPLEALDQEDCNKVRREGALALLDKLSSMDPEDAMAHVRALQAQRKDKEASA